MQAGPENPFAAVGVGAQYALGRPYHHPRALARALGRIGVRHIDRALDVACGTGLSTTALSEVADVVVGVDRSPEMLAVAPRLDAGWYIRSSAESLPFAAASFDVITVSSGVHWFDQPRFFAEAHRLLRPQAWVVLYDHYFIGEMVGVPEFGAWATDALARYPLPPRNKQVGDPRNQTPVGFESTGDDFYADDIEMTHRRFVDYQLSISNFVTACEQGADPDEVRGWLTESTASFYSDTPVRVVRFLGSVTCLRALP
jgi:SAM-dependent methyltransferase